MFSETLLGPSLRVAQAPNLAATTLWRLSPVGGGEAPRHLRDHATRGQETYRNNRLIVTKRKADVIESGVGEAKKVRPVSNAEINRELTALKRMFSLAIQAGRSSTVHTCRC